MKKLILLALTFAASVFGQAVRFDTNTYTTNGSCVSGKQCPVLAIPGATVAVCNPPNCASKATTYTNAGAGTSCATNSQLTPSTGGACTPYSDAQGNAGFWILPGSYNYYITLPNGGATYGPYPISVGSSQGCPSGATCDANYNTLAAACSAAGTGTLYVTRTWNALSTQTFACNMTFLGNGKLTPASGQTVTLTGQIVAPPSQIFDYSLGGTVVITGAKTAQVFPQWAGVLGNDSTDNSTTMGYANALSRNLFWIPGVYRFSTSPAIQLSANWTCASNRTTVFRATGTHGLQFAAHTASARNDTRISNCGFVADGAATQDAVYAENVYGLYLDNPKAGLATYFGLTGLSANSASAGYFVIDNTGTDNSSFITIIQPEVQGGSGSAITAHTDTTNGVAGLTVIGGELHEMDRYGFETTGTGGGAHEYHLLGITIEGNAMGEIKSGWATGATIIGNHFEHVAATVPLQINNFWAPGVNGGAILAGQITNNNIGCGSAPYGIELGNISSRDTVISENVFAHCGTEAVHFGGGAKIDYRLISNRLSVGTPKLYNYDDFTLNVANLCIQDVTLGNGCYSTTSDGSPQTQTGALNYIATETGANNAIKGTLTMASQLQGPGFNPFTDGMTVTVKLAHTLQAGANTFDLNPVNSAGPRSIKSQRDPTANIATAYAVGGYITLRWNSAVGVWMDVSQ